MSPPAVLSLVTVWVLVVLCIALLADTFFNSHAFDIIVLTIE